MNWYFVIAVVILVKCVNLSADVIKLNLPVISDSPGVDHYFHELLEQSVTDIGHTPKFFKKVLPQSRVKAYLESGKICVYWMVRSKERDERYTPIWVGLTNGLVGKRVLFIKRGYQSIYDRVNTLDEFRSLGLIGGMGQDWYDVAVWKMNNLKYKEKSGNWQSIFPRVAAGRDYNYFSRGINEIIFESQQYPDLAIEKRLLLEYNRDFKLYVSKSEKANGQKYYAVLEKAIRNAKESGLITRMVNKYWEDDLKKLNYENRITLKLKSPE